MYWVEVDIKLFERCLRCIFFLDLNIVDFCLKFKYKSFIKIFRNVFDL